MTIKKIIYSQQDGDNQNMAFPAGTLVIDSNNHLKMHDGTTQGGNAISGATSQLVNGNYTLGLDSNGVLNMPVSAFNTAQLFAPNGNDLLLGTSSHFVQVKGDGTGIVFADNTTQSTAFSNAAVSTYLANYDGTINFTASPAIISGVAALRTNTLSGPVSPSTGRLVENVEVYAGAGAPYTYVWIGNNPIFASIYSLGDLTGWVFYPTGHPEQAVTVTSMNPVGSNSLGFSGSLPFTGTYTAHSPDYAPGTPSDLNVTVNAHTWKFDTTGTLTFPDTTVQRTAWAGGRVVAAPTHSTGATGDKAGDIAFDGSYLYYCKENYGYTTIYGPASLGRAGSYSSGASYGFGAELHAYNLVGTHVLINGVDTGVTVVAQDNTFNAGAQTGLDFSGPFTAAADNWTFITYSGTDIWVRVAWSGSTW